ncbi:MAG: CapA family protein [Tissierellia bacterium]|nr:CapA family protein [Tissierellia bacterium]
MDNQVQEYSKISEFKKKILIAKRNKINFSTAFVAVLAGISFLLVLVFGKETDLTAGSNYEYKTLKTNHTKITFAGDVSPGRYLRATGEQKGFDVFYQDVKSVWKDSDVSIVNLEASPLSEKPNARNYSDITANETKIRLDVTKDEVKALKDTGINLIGFANNHASDYGIKGLQDSFSIFKELNLEFVGAGNNINEAIKPYSKVINGKSVSIVGITDRAPFRVAGGYNLPRVFTTSYIYTDYELGRTFNSNDFNIVFIHWGTENALRPDSDIQELGRKYIDMGADLVIGAHPHVLLPVEKYNGGAIVYSMGNFVFDQVSSRNPYSAIGSVYFNDSERFLEFLAIKSEKGIPIIQEDNSNMNKSFDALTRGLSIEDYEIKDGKLIIEF